MDGVSSVAQQVQDTSPMDESSSSSSTGSIVHDGFEETALART